MTKPFAITLDIGSSLANHTGSWRTERPVYVHRLPPCNDACPAGEDVQGWLYDGEAGNYESAWRHLTRDNPLPAIMGRICYHPCQTACNRGELDESVGINSVERFLGDHAISQGWQFTVEAPPTGKKVLVVGSGPSGLSAAYHLALKGHAVTIREGAPSPGGMMRYGIPAYRLPRDVLDAEILRITNIGVTIECNSKVEDANAALEEGFDAVFLAIGAHLGKRAYIPAGDTAHILDAVSMLHMTAEGEWSSMAVEILPSMLHEPHADSARTKQSLSIDVIARKCQRTKSK
jgi:NADPH-dependent glutamate synthase beta subunit-like oxidoreductase